jgi:4-hydroxybenzoate polyprenyltransferase
MIQRKQTVWLLLSIVMMVLAIYLPYGYHSIQAPTATAIKTEALNAKQTIPMIFVTIVIALAGFGIFMFKNRGLQKLLCIAGVLVALGMGVYEFFDANQIVNNKTINFGIAFPVLAAIFFLAGFNGIRADEKLLKSMDRLRD